MSQLESLRTDEAADDSPARPGTAALLERLYPRLRQAAAGLLRDEHAVSLTPGDLLHQAAINLLKIDRIAWESDAHFRSMAARLMRRVLVDHVRAKHAKKRQHVRVTLATHFDGDARCDLNELNEALLRLAAISPEGADIVEMRYFGGMSVGDIATVTGLSEPTVKRRWAVARGWLVDAMASPQ